MNACHRHAGRRGASFALTLVLLPTILGLIALALDIGYLCVARSNLQACADSAALAGASGMVYGPDEARTRACAFASKNHAGGSAVTLLPEDIELGTWDSTKRVFTPLTGDSSTHAQAVRVKPKLLQARGTGVGLILARILGIQTADVSTSAIATFRSRDVALVLDYSASMAYDSELGVSHLKTSDVVNTINGMYLDLGSPKYGNMQLSPVYISSTTESTIKSTLGLTNVPYPYPSGSWSEYFSYVQNDSSIAAAGYQKKYGYLTLINYWQAVQYKASQTPNLWKAREQPIQAVKDSVSVFLGYMQQGRTDDRAALVTYTSSTGDATLEMPLTTDLDLVKDTCRHGQAGKYHTYTNIGAGIASGRTELVAHGRLGTLRMMVLLSDGNSNWYHNQYDTYSARNEALNQAQLTAASKIIIVTISLGADADADLMQKIADITGGKHFIVPGGSNVSDYENQLLDVFRQIAANCPLKLVD